MGLYEGKAFWDVLAYNLKSIFADSLYKPKKVRSKTKEKSERVLPATKVKKPEMSKEKGLVVKRSADLRKWKIIWHEIHGWNDDSDNEVSRKLKERQGKHMFPSRLPIHPDTIAKIRRAGYAHLLDED
jgi:hypothetical protein